MAELKSPTRVEVLTKDGECKLHIVIDLNINLTTNNVEVIKSRQTDIPDVQEEEKTEWSFPSFKSGEKVKFGKKE